ncbi:helix-turn-helix transcriptional regulator [Lichenihabitans sp. Uapishka_5]|uniref:helix-turn-helix transcriptional regulator n=1 Tax=Lichenihabitans sp. Uapishka_5 TaxID=3037302 RepID=UPI0029E81BB3|nr:helix-turn-helix transcriptional regulator [Lichenihabitans sp. Uapishka_5]MDX7952640.1 helix-turn-helix transcriptional regulator [Lichenihabitans sp. Uapishka_5]
MPDDAQRELGAFLRAHRERLKATDLGLRPQGRRRTPGLRREEVADLCGLSPTWLSWIEQGRDVSASPAALSRLGDALRLSRAERAYLFELARKQDPKIDSAPDEAVPLALGQVLASTTVPAYGLDRLWQLCGRNAAAARLFSPWLDGGEPNLLGFVFCDPAARRFICDWDVRARRLVAEFRADTSRLGDDPDTTALVAHLRRESATFDGFWQARDVVAREGGARAFHHPADGILHYEQATLHIAGHERFKLVMLFPVGA